MVTPSCHTSIHKLPLIAFIDAFVDDDLSGLILSGEPSKEQLEDAWAKILGDYNAALSDGTMETMHTLGIYRTVVRLDHEIRSVETFLEILKRYHVEEFAREINRILFSKFKFNPENPQEYDRELRSASTRLGGHRVRLAVEKSRLQAKMNRKIDVSAEKPTRQYFIGLLLNLSDFAGYDIKEDEISVFKFCERVKRYNQAMEQLKAGPPKPTRAK